MNIRTLLCLSVSLMLCVTLFSQKTYSTMVFGVCGMCEVRIEDAVEELDFVTSAEWDVDYQRLTIEHTEEFDEDKLHHTITSVGHDTGLKKASQEAYDGVHGCCKYRDHQMMSDHGVTPYNLTIENVRGVCEMCKERIEKAVNSLEFVKASKYNIEEQFLVVQYTSEGNEFTDSKAADKIARTIAGVGHDAGEYKAKDEDYESLHDCCKYRDPKVLKDHGFDVESQNTQVSGYVYEDTGNGRTPLAYAEVFTEDKEHFTVTDDQGYFELEVPSPSTDIVINYIGYTPDTLNVKGIAELEIVLSNVKDLQEVVVSYDRKTSSVSSLKTIKSIEVDDDEFLKAACCNLSESFETLPAVDVATTDAVTGTRQIKMLGLAGPNILYTREQIPTLNGISSTQGLSLIPGTWIEGMNINQSIGSVAEGYQSVSGQINVELRKPDNMDPAFINVYGNEGGRLEANVHLAHRFNEKVSTGLLLHGNTRNRELDRNNDQFMDSPTGDGFIALNRWKYHSQKNLMGQAGVKYAHSNSESGQLSGLEAPNLWRSNTKISDLQSWAKMGYVLPNAPNSSFAIRLGVNSYHQMSTYGNRDYEGTQDNVHAKLLYQGLLGGSPNHKIRTGMGINVDNTDEQLAGMNYELSEVVPHAFAEYTLDIGKSFSAITGLRYDMHNIYDGFLTPRLHLRYNFDLGMDLRASAGQARRMPSIISENISFLASSRTLNVEDEYEFQPYGLPMIKSSNFSLSADYGWELFEREASLSLDYFYTQFDENVIVDMDADVQQLKIYAQDENSLSHNFQAQFDFRPMKGMDIRMAYKWQRLMLGYENGLREAPFTPAQRGFLNMAYTTENKWSFDLTFNLTGPQRIPDTQTLPEEIQMESESPAFLRVNGQINKVIFPGFTVYAGVENLTNYQQEYAIINADEPFSDNFDASLIWGPTMGRNVYVGVRYTIVEFEENKFAVQ